MGVTGGRFLELTKAEGLEISGHALCRLRERTGRSLSEEESFKLFLSARQIRADEMIMLGSAGGSGAPASQAAPQAASQSEPQVVSEPTSKAAEASNKDEISIEDIPF